MTNLKLYFFDFCCTSIGQQIVVGFSFNELESAKLQKSKIAVLLTKFHKMTE